MSGFRKARVADPPATPAGGMLPPAARFRLVRHFSVASIAAFLLFAAGLVYFEHLKDDFFGQAQEEQARFFSKMQDDFMQRHDAAALAYLLRVYEAGNINLGRLFSNAMWEQDFAPFVARVQRISAHRCRAIADAKDAGGKPLPEGGKRDCQAEVGRQIMALPQFRALDAKMFATLKHNTVLKLTVYDLRGIVVYSSEHRQIGQDAFGNPGWESAAAGRPASELTRRDRFRAFEGEVANRQLVSSYLPIHAARTGSVVGVIEIHTDATPFVDRISGTALEIRKAIAGNQVQLEQSAAASRKAAEANRNRLFAAVFGTLALLYLVLFLVVRNAQRIIDRQDVERRRAALTLARQKDLYEALSRTNKAIVHLASREELFQTVCRIAVEHGRFRFAWIGLIDRDDLPLKPVARYGEDGGYMDQLEITGDSEGNSGRGLTGRTLHSGTHLVSNDFLNDPEMAPWREAGRRAGVRASAKFPIRQGGAMVGAISFYAGEAGSFTEELVAMLEEMALDVSFALDNFQREAERKRAIETLRDNERLLKESQSIAGLGSYVLDIPLDRWSSSAVLDDIFGIDGNYERSVAGWLSLVHPEWQERMSRYFADEVLRKRGRFDSEYRIIRRTDGEARWVHGLGELEFDAQGQPSRLVGTIMDITERRKADEAMRQSEGRLRAIFDAALDGILVADVSLGRFLTGNPAICRMLGYTPEEIVHIGVADIHPEHDLPHAKTQLERLARGEIQIAADIPVLRKDGSVFFADIKATPIRLGDQDNLLGVFRDVTERRQSEEALRAAEQQFRGLVEQSIAGILIIQDRRFAYVNPRLCEVHGYTSQDELVGTDPLALIAEKDRPAATDAMRRLLAGEVDRIAHTLTALRKDGSTVELGINSARASYRGRPAVIAMMQDISEKKRAEEQIQRYVAQLEKAFMSTVGVATTMSEMRDPYTSGHERRVAEIAVAIGAELGLDARRQEGLRVAGYLHDVGKITIPSEILSKPGRLSPIEFRLIQGHAQASYDILKNVEFPWPVAEVALQHHERLDGSGYPQGLKGEAILLEARIMSVADVVEAMASHRPYRPGLGIDKALAEIERGRGGAYDPEVADACLRLFREQGYAIPQ